MLKLENIGYNNIENLQNFHMHAHGNYVVITAKSQNKINNYTFLATTPIVKYILCDMNQKIIIGSLSKCQLGNIIAALENIGCDFQLLIINNKLALVSKNKHKVKVKKAII